MSTVRYTRTNPDLQRNTEKFKLLKDHVYEGLDKAEYLFERGMSVSPPRGIMSVFILSPAPTEK